LVVIGPAHRHIEYSPRHPDLPRGDEHQKARAASPNEPVVVETFKRFLTNSRTYGVSYRSRVVKAWACERKARWPIGIWPSWSKTRSAIMGYFQDRRVLHAG